MDTQKNSHAKKLGGLSWSKLTPERRTEIARAAALKRWENYRKRKAKEKQLGADI